VRYSGDPYIACQSRDGDLDEFFLHENHSYPPSISQGGNLRLGTKSDLIGCLEQCCESSSAVPTVQTMIVDGSVIVQMLRPSVVQNFQQYATEIFLPYVMQLINNVQRLDIVFDVYHPDSLKLATREKRGHGIRRRVAANLSVPKNWQDFLRVDENKTELFSFLAETLTREEMTGKHLLVTAGDQVLCNPAQDTSRIAPCSHEEADTRMFLHCLDASLEGSKSIAIKTVDTDIVVLGVSLFTSLNLDELWITFGTGKNLRHIPAHELCRTLGPDKSKALPMFHSFTGCDTVSCFMGKGKKTAWDAWRVFPEVTAAFADLCDSDDQINPSIVAILERFTVIMYSRTSEALDVNSARRQLFAKTSCPLESLPPTSDALLLHTKRAFHQTVHCWKQSLILQPRIYDPCNWGWSNEDGTYTPVWTTLQEASKICSELVHCSCKKGCTARCKCVKADLVCTALCKCDGDCER